MEKGSFKTWFIKAFLMAGITAFFAFISAYLKSCIHSKESKTEATTTIIDNSDSTSSNKVTNKDVTIGQDQINGAKDINSNNRKIEVKGNAFFDSSKQVNTRNYYQGLKQRHIDLELMSKIIDSIPAKTTKIEISCGGDGEGEHLGQEIADYLIKKGYSKPDLIPWSLTGNYDITEYKLEANGVFGIYIHPQRNDKQMY